MEGRCGLFEAKPNPGGKGERSKKGVPGCRYVPDCLVQRKSWAWLAGPNSDQWRVVDWTFWWSRHSISHFGSVRDLEQRPGVRQCHSLQAMRSRDSDKIHFEQPIGKTSELRWPAKPAEHELPREGS